ncbi:MAG: hypothetical protein WBG44_10575 [Comamonas sp.]
MPFTTCRAPLACLLLAAAGWLAGCAALDSYPVTGQKKVHAIHHWDVIAQDVATRVAERIASWPQGEHPIHVSAAEPSEFNEGFVKLLRVHLLDRGVALSVTPSAVELRVQTQLVDPAGRGARGDAAGGPTRTEVLVTTTLTNEDLYLTGTADMYYIERADAALYVPPPPPPPAPVVKTWKVVTP